MTLLIRIQTMPQYAYLNQPYLHVFEAKIELDKEVLERETIQS